MQPGPPPERPPQGPSAQPGRYSSESTAGWPPTPGQRPPRAPADVPPGGPPPPPPPTATATEVQATATQRRGRAGIVGLVALLVEIIAIAAADNQWSAKHLATQVNDHPSSINYDLVSAVLTFQWRFSPLASDRFHVLYAQFALLGVVVIGSASLIAGVARGGSGFWRVLFGTWTAVVAATGVGAIVRGLVANSALLGGESRLQFALFSSIGPTQHVFAGGLALGLLTGLAAAITAVIVRHDEPVTVPATIPALPADPGGPVGPGVPGGPGVPARDEPTRQFERPQFADAPQQHFGRPGEQTTQFQRPTRHEAPTQQFERHDEPTPPADAPTTSPATNPEATQHIPAAERPGQNPDDPAAQFRGRRDEGEPDATQELPRTERP